MPPVFVMASPVSLFLQSLSYLPVLMLPTLGSALMLGLSTEALGLFPDCTVRLYSRLQGGGPLGCPRAVAVWYLWSDSVCGQRGTNATNVGSRAVQAVVLPGVILTLIPKVRLVVRLKGFPGSSPLPLGSRSTS